MHTLYAVVFRANAAARVAPRLRERRVGLAPLAPLAA
jgi:hypothetical protein